MEVTQEYTGKTFIDMRSVGSKNDRFYLGDLTMDEKDWVNKALKVTGNKELVYPTLTFKQLQEPFTVTRLQTRCRDLKYDDIDPSIFETQENDSGEVLTTNEDCINFFKNVDSYDAYQDELNEEACDSVRGKKMFRRVVRSVDVVAFGQCRDEKYELLFEYHRDENGVSVKYKKEGFFHYFTKHKSVMRDFAQDEKMIEAIQLLLSTKNPYDETQATQGKNRRELLKYFCDKVKRRRSELELPNDLIIYHGVEDRNENAKGACEFLSYTTSPAVAAHFEYMNEDDVHYITTTVGKLVTGLKERFPGYNLIPLWLSDKCAPMHNWLAEDLLDQATERGMYAANKKMFSICGFNEFEILFTLVEEDNLSKEAFKRKWPATESSGAANAKVAR